MAVGSILWTTAMFTMALFAQSKLMLMIPIGLAGFGSGAWHPQAAANATIAGGKRYAATASSVFFFGGTLGTAVIGSALGGYLLENYGIRSLLVISSLTAILAITVVRQLVPLRLEVNARDALLTRQRQTPTIRRTGPARLSGVFSLCCWWAQPCARSHPTASSPTCPSSWRTAGNRPRAMAW